MTKKLFFLQNAICKLRSFGLKNPLLCGDVLTPQGSVPVARLYVEWSMLGQLRRAANVLSIWSYFAGSLGLNC